MSPPRNDSDSRKPIHTIRQTGPDSVLELNVWRNTVEVESGEEIEVDAITISRSYKDGDKWKKTHSLRTSDLLMAAHMMQRAFDWLTET